MHLNPNKEAKEMAALPTTRIKNPKDEGFILINEADFDPQRHKRWEGSGPKEEGQQEVEQKNQGKAPAAGQRKQGA